MKILYQSMIGIIAIWLLSAGVQAAGSGGTVSLRAVMPGGAPLMRPVAWKIYELRNNRKLFATGFNRHSGVIDLPQGNYVAEIIFSGIRYEQPFTLKPHHDVDVTISVQSETRVF